MAQADRRNWAAALTSYRQALQSRPTDHVLRSRVFQAEMERGREAVERVYQETLAGKTSPNEGHVLSLRA